MSETKPVRKAKVIPFISKLDKDRDANFAALLQCAKTITLDGFEQVSWDDAVWHITGGRLIKLTGRNMKSAALYFIFPPKLGGNNISESWADLIKAFFILRFHRKNQALPNHRNFIAAVAYIAYVANEYQMSVPRLTPEVLDMACLLIQQHYSDAVAYNMHKHIAEFAANCDVNGLCCITLHYRYSSMKRPSNVDGVGHTRLDDPKVLNTQADKFINANVFKVIGSLFQQVPKEHKYRFYILILTLLACTGRRFSEIALMPYQQLNTDKDGKRYLLYFPRKVSKGDTFTPVRKLYLPSEVVVIVDEVIQELNTLCASGRSTACEMARVKGPDMRFAKHITEDKRLYKNDIQALGVSPQIIAVGSWMRDQELAYIDPDAVNKKGVKHKDPVHYITKAGLSAYCARDFNMSSLNVIHIDQQGKKYYLKDLLLVRHIGLSSGRYSTWIATQCTHSMMTTFLRYLPKLAEEYAAKDFTVNFTSHHFRHTLNTLLDEGGLSDLLQTEWFGRSNPHDTKSYQHTSREKRALMLRDEIKNGNVGGKFAKQIQLIPLQVQEAVLKARIQAVHDVGTGICIHNFAQTPCERHLQCSADCHDYVWVKEDKARLHEQKRQYALTLIAREVAEEKTKQVKPKKSQDWFIHNQKKLHTLSQQLTDNGIDIHTFDHHAFLKELSNENTL